MENEDTLKLILGFTNNVDLCVVSGVCKQWKLLCMEFALKYMKGINFYFISSFSKWFLFQMDTAINHANCDMMKRFMENHIITVHFYVKMSEMKHRNIPLCFNFKYRIQNYQMYQNYQQIANLK